MTKTIYGAALVALLLASPAVAETASYNVRIDAKWTAKNHPIDYPSDAHFSGIVGATHNANYAIFKDGGTASEGLEKLAETGAHTPLDKEINAAIGKGDAGVLFESGPLFQFPGQIQARFDASEKYPFVSLVAMIAPSPDWFTGVSSVALRKDGKWLEKVTVTLWAYDAGTDHGTTYKSADADAQPQQSVRVNAAQQFLAQDGLKPVGTVTFTRVGGSMARK